MLAAFFSALYQSSVNVNEQNIVDLAARFAKSNTVNSICDLGCGDGRLTCRVADAVSASFVGVVEGNPKHAALARERGHYTWDCDLNGNFTIDRWFDIVFSNQVIEHLYDTDQFLAQIRNILRPGGLLIISTENAASWHNIAALVLGWQSFSSSNYSKVPVGNPLALHAGVEHGEFAMQHHRIFSLRGLRETIASQNYHVTAVRGAGYYPLPASVGKLDPAHAHFITVAATA